MTEIEMVVAAVTLVAAWGTIIKISEKHTAWYWNFAPALIGATSIMWLARFAG